MEFKKYILDNKLTIVGEVNNNAKSAAVGFFVKTGSRDESPEVSGVSHFLEHMLFKGTEELSPMQVNQMFDNVGAQFNAFTSEEMTVFFSAVLPEYLEEITELWSKLMRPGLKKEDFDIEKNVIMEEIAMYKDLPNYDVIDKCRRLYFQDHPGGNSVLGTEETIDNLSLEQMKDYFFRRYSPGNITAVLTGNFDWDKMTKTIEDFCSSWQYKDLSRDVREYEGAKQQKKETRDMLSRDHICLMSPSVAAQDQRRYTASLLASIIGDGTGSRYFWKIIDKAKAESANMQYSSMDGTGLLCSYFTCSPEKSAEVLEIADSIFEDLKENGIKENELVAAQNKVVSAMALKNEIPMGRLVDIGFNWLYLNSYKKIEEEVEAVKSVSKDDVDNLIRDFDLEKYTIYSIGPKS